MILRFLHVSDTHGDFPSLWGRHNFVVHTGDFFPNRHNDKDPFKPGSKFGRPDREYSFQADWAQQNVKTIARWLGGKKMLFCPGNHDYYDPSELFKANGIDFVNLASGPEVVDGIPFYGFPHCPITISPWNYATGSDEMAKYIDEMDAAMKDYENVVIAAHCPPMGILDKARGGVSYGNSLMANYLSYKALNVRAFLCGHIHEDHGITMFSNILISNAACVVHNLQLEFWRSKFED